MREGTSRQATNDAATREWRDCNFNLTDPVLSSLEWSLAYLTAVVRSSGNDDKFRDIARSPGGPLKEFRKVVRSPGVLQAPEQAEAETILVAAERLLTTGTAMYRSFVLWHPFRSGRRRSVGLRNPGSLAFGLALGLLTSLTGEISNGPRPLARTLFCRSVSA